LTSTSPETKSFEIGPYTLTGFSLGGVETVVHIPELRLAIDVGRGPQSIVRCDHLALTHTHMDHAAGVAYLLALRQLYGMAPPTLYLPDQMVEAFAGMLKAWEKVQRYPLTCPIVGMESGKRVPLGRDVSLEAFRTYHPIPSMGYTIVRQKKRLRADLVGLTGPRIAELRRAGDAVDEVVEERLLSVTGDTLPEVLDKQPQILESDTLMMECTFLNAKKPLADARAGGHVHLNELWSRTSSFRNRRLIFSHMSQLHPSAEIELELKPFAASIAPELYRFPTEAGGAIVRIPRD
jgi:ribonuclease Z